MRWLVNAFSLNMLPEGGGRIDVREVDLSEARALAASATSAVGHADTAAVFASQLEREVALNRATVVLEAGEELVVGQLRGPRLPEGATRLPPGGSIVWFHVVCEALAGGVGRASGDHAGASAAGER